ncbi:MAG: ABC transporter permease [Dehalococcoidia bacterium]|nr:ABC transporter permease [Dehalococcoidia bacterium]
MPPFWVGPDVSVKEVVESKTGKREERQGQILLSDAQRRAGIGEATVVGGSPDQEVSVGDEVEIVSQRGGSTKYLLGTDKLGRDILSRIIHGARVSLTVSLLAVVLGGGIGTILGLVAGCFGGVWDSLIMRLVDLMLAFPSILLALVMVAAIGSGYSTVIIVIVVLLWSRYARVVRGEALAIKQSDYVARARVAGASHMRIMIRHIFPNLVNTVIVLATLEVGAVIILESTLSFLGAGIPRPTPAWGVMVADGRELIIANWWIFFFPTMAIVLTVLSMNLLGDWLRDRLDPRLRNV